MTGSNMKYLLFTTLENTKETHDLIHKLSNLGYNGTVLSSTSLKHILNDENEDVPSFFSLAHYHENKFVQNTTIYFILNDYEVKEVQEEIRIATNNFKSTKGGMFVTKLDSFEGSF